MVNAGKYASPMDPIMGIALKIRYVIGENFPKIPSLWDNGAAKVD